MATETDVEPDVPRARVLPSQDEAQEDSAAWIRRGVFVGVLVIGWLFIVWSNKFHVTAPVVFVCFGYLAVISTVYNLWRTGAAAVAPEAAVDVTWGRPIGARGQLEKEKKTLLKAIKEAEFDHAMGKLSKTDADELIRSYRARAIEVIKEIDRLDAGAALSTRDQIAREVRARVELAASDKPSKRVKNAAASTAADVKAAKSDAEDALVDAVEATAAGRLEAPREPRPSVLPDRPAYQPMPGKLTAVVVFLLVGVVANFASSGYVSGGIGIVLAAGVLLGNDGVRTFLRGLAVIELFWVATMSFASANGVPNQHGLVILGLSLIGPVFMIWALGQQDVRDWMFRTSFKLAAAPVTTPSAPEPKHSAAAPAAEPAAPAPATTEAAVEATKAEAS